MIEATSTVILNAPVLRQFAESISSTKSYAANPDKLQEAPQAPYISPYISIDTEYNKAIIQLRNSTTGEVVDQIPTESALERDKQLSEERENNLNRSINFDTAATPDVTSGETEVSTTEASSTPATTETSTPDTGGSTPERGSTVSLLA